MFLIPLIAPLKTYNFQTLYSLGLSARDADSLVNILPSAVAPAPPHVSPAGLSQEQPLDGD